MNLIMDVLAALALATEMPTDALLDRRPYDRRTHLISYSMIRFIVVHSTIQVTKNSNGTQIDVVYINRFLKGSPQIVYKGPTIAKYFSTKSG